MLIVLLLVLLFVLHCAAVCVAVCDAVYAPAMRVAICCAAPSSWYFTEGSPFLRNCASSLFSNEPGEMVSSIKASITIVAVDCC